MTNTDTAYGLHNKLSSIVKVYNITKTNDPAGRLTGEEFAGTLDTNSVVSQSFGGNVETAKSFFYTDDALNCFNTNGTQLSWAITDDGNGLQFTIAFGIPKNPSATPWADAWKNTKQTLIDAGNWFKIASLPESGQGFYIQTTDSHLF